MIAVDKHSEHLEDQEKSGKADMTPFMSLLETFAFCLDKRLDRPAAKMTFSLLTKPICYKCGLVPDRSQVIYKDGGIKKILFRNQTIDFVLDTGKKRSARLMCRDCSEKRRLERTRYGTLTLSEKHVIRGKYKVVVYGRYDLQTILDLIPSKDIKFDEYQTPLTLDSLRFRMFKEKGVQCVSCSRKGDHWKLIDNSNRKEQKPHFNLYSEDEIVMTKDHIIPRARGGPDTLSNLQPMCEVCNNLKGCSY